MHDQRSYALRDSLEQLHRTATLVRDQISHDAWRMLNALHVDRRWRQAKGTGLAWPMLELLDEGIRALNAFSGTEAENMTRNFAWRFLEIGRRIERARQLAEFTACSGLRRAGARERRQPAAAAGAGRQLHDLSLALPDDAAHRARCSTCCCSTRPTRAASPSSWPGSTPISSCCRARARIAAPASG